MFIQWSDALETHQTLIDAEHQLLVFLFRKLDVAIKTGESQLTLLDIIGETKRFVEFHFSSEENLMRETRYPHFAAHQAQHRDLTTKLGAMMSKIVARREFPEDLLFFLNEWLIEHIARHDQHLALHVRGSEARPIAEHAYRECMTLNRATKEAPLQADN